MFCLFLCKHLHATGIVQNYSYKNLPYFNKAVASRISHGHTSLSKVALQLYLEQ